MRGSRLKLWKTKPIRRALAGALEGVERVHDLAPRNGVEVAGGLIGQDDGGVVHKGACDGDALHLAARELVCAMVVVVDGKAY